MEEARNRKELEHLELTSGEGLELVPLLKNLRREVKNPVTGFVLFLTNWVYIKRKDFGNHDGNGDS